MTDVKKPSDFKNTVFDVRNGQESKRVQEAMFKLGFKWFHMARKGLQREVLNLGGPCYIYVSRDYRLSYSRCGIIDPSTGAANFTPVKDLYAAAEAHQVAKRIERKASRKRRSLMREQGWILNTGVMPDVNGEVEVWFFYNDAPSAVNMSARNWAWHIDLPQRAYDIQWWRPVVQPKPVTCTIEDMVADIVQQAGGSARVDVPQVNLDGWIEWDGTGYEYTSECMSGPVGMGTLVDIKFRNGRVFAHRIAGAPTSDAAGAFWRNDDSDYDIVAYRLSAAPETFEIRNSESVCTGATNFGAEAYESDDALDPNANPKHAIGNTSLPMTMVSPLYRAMVATAKQNGALKYGGSNYLGTRVVMSTYLNAIQRHLDKIIMGEVVDAVDGVDHFGAIGANCDILVSARAAGTLIDDRLLATGQAEAYYALTPLVAELAELHKDRNPKHYYMNK